MPTLPLVLGSAWIYAPREMASSADKDPVRRIDRAENIKRSWLEHVWIVSARKTVVCAVRCYSSKTRSH